MLTEKIRSKLASLSFGSQASQPHTPRLNSRPGSKGRLRGSRDSSRDGRRGNAANDGAGQEEEDEEIERLPITVAVRCRPPISPDQQALEIKNVSKRQETATISLSMPANAVEQPAYSEELRRFREKGARLFRGDAFIGPDGTQEHVFDEVAPVVERVLDGASGLIMCYGQTGTGKTHTLFGPPSASGVVAGRNAGIAQRASQLIFDQVREKSSQGGMFVVEASFLEICPSDGSKDELLDLLADELRPMEIKPDPINQHSFICEGLRRVPIRTPEEMCQLISQGQQLSADFERSHRAHYVFSVAVESFSQDFDMMSQPTVQCGELFLVDLAGSESFIPASINDRAAQVAEVLRRTYAFGIARSLSSLGTALNAANMSVAQPPDKDSALSLVLHSCLGCTAHGLLVVNISPELDDVDETVKSLTLAQHVLGGKAYIPGSEDHVSQIKQQHADCFRQLEEQVVGSRETDSEQKLRIRAEVERIGKLLADKDESDQRFQQLQEEQFSKVNEFGSEMVSAIRNEIQTLRTQSTVGANGLKASMERHVATIDEIIRKQKQKAKELQMGRLRAEIQELTSVQRTSEEELARLRVQQASSEERISTQTDRQQELQKERAEFKGEEMRLKQQTEEQWERLLAAQAEVNGFKAEAEVYNAELARLNALKSFELDACKQEQEIWRAREVELTRELATAKQLEGETKIEGEVQVSKMQTEQADVIEQMKHQIKELEQSAVAQEENMAVEVRTSARLEEEMSAISKREDVLRQKTADKIKRCHFELQKELQQVQTRESELMRMLHEIQDSVIRASSIPEHEDENSPKY